MSSYVTVDEMQRLIIGAARLSTLAYDTQQNVLDAVSTTADSYLASRFPVPLAAAGPDLKRAIAHIAAYELLLLRGLNPADDSVAALKELRDEAMAWLKSTSEGDVSPLGLHTSGGSASESSRQYVVVAGLDDNGLPVVETPIPRGW